MPKHERIIKWFRRNKDSNLANYNLNLNINGSSWNLNQNQSFCHSVVLPLIKRCSECDKFHLNSANFLANSNISNILLTENLLKELYQHGPTLTNTELFLCRFGQELQFFIFFMQMSIKFIRNWIIFLHLSHSFCFKTENCIYIQNYIVNAIFPLNFFAISVNYIYEYFY